MTSFSRDYLNFLLQRYADYRSTATLWEQAGGNIGEIDDTAPAMDRWPKLLRIAEHGAIQPVNLTLAALARNPHNPILIADLQARLPQELQKLGRDVVQQVRDGQGQQARSLLSTSTASEEQLVAATVVATEEAEVESTGTREVMGEFLKSTASAVGQGIGQGLVNAVLIRLGMPPLGGS